MHIARLDGANPDKAVELHVKSATWFHRKCRLPFKVARGVRNDPRRVGREDDLSAACASHEKVRERTDALAAVKGKVWSRQKALGVRISRRYTSPQVLKFAEVHFQAKETEFRTANENLACGSAILG